jgi:hypothetical protein
MDTCSELVDIFAPLRRRTNPRVLHRRALHVYMLTLRGQPCECSPTCSHPDARSTPAPRVATITCTSAVTDLIRSDLRQYAFLCNLQTTDRFVPAV